MRKLEHIIKVDVTFPHDTSHQVKMVTEDFREFLQLFDEKNREYGSDNAFVLGSAGQFADIWRKIGKLKTALWDKKPEQLTSEGTEEIIQDLMGHLFLTLQCLRKEDRGPKLPPGDMLTDIAGPTDKLELSLDTKPELAKGMEDVESPFSLPNDGREYKFSSGDRVRNKGYGSGAWLDGATGIVVKQDRVSAGIWYKVDFGPKAGEITCSENGLELVK